MTTILVWATYLFLLISTFVTSGVLGISVRRMKDKEGFKDDEDECSTLAVAIITLIIMLLLMGKGMHNLAVGYLQMGNLYLAKILTIAVGTNFLFGFFGASLFKLKDDDKPPSE